MLYILNKDTEVVGTLTSRGSVNATPYFDDEFLMDLSTGAETFSFSTFSNTPQAHNIEVGNYIAFKYKDEFKLFQIIDTEEAHSEEFVKSAYCEMAGIELINEIVRPMTMNAVSVKKFADTILADTSWTVGYVDSSVADVHTIELKEYSTAYSLIQSHIIGTFGAEVSFTVSIKGGQVVGRYLNIYRERGDFDGFRFEYGKNVSEVVKSVDSSELVTALIGVGKDNLTFKSASASDKPVNQDFIADEEAFYQWNKNGNHIMGVYKHSTTESPEELLKLTRQELQRRKNPKITYSLRVGLVDESLEIGNTVYVIDKEYTPALHLSARVSKLKVSFTDSEKNECTLANFKEVKSNITEDMRLIASIIDDKFPIGTGDIKDGAVNGDKLQDGAVNRPQLIQKDTIITEHLQADTIQAEHIKSDQIQTKHLTADSITAQKIKSQAIETKHLTADLIESSHIKADQITADHIQSGSIETDHIKAGQVVSSHIMADQIDADHLKADSVTAGAIQSGSVNTDKLSAGAVTADKVSAGAITTDKLQAGAVTTQKLSAGSVTTDKLSAGSVNADKLQANSIKSTHIQAGQVQAGHIGANQIQTGHLQAGSVTAAQLSANSVNADKIQAGSIKAGHLSTTELISDKAQIGTGVIQSAHIGQGQITTAHIGSGQITSATILDGAISSAKISNGSITNAKIADATIENAKIKNVNASKINAGTINTGLVEVSGTNGKLKIKNNRLQVFDAQATPVERVSVGDVNGDGTLYGLRVRGSDGRTVLYDENGVYEEGITDGAITNPKIDDNAIDTRTLNIENIFVSDSAFVKNLQAVELNADQITTGKINSERLDINGLVSFEALDKDLANSFVVSPDLDKTYINGANILAGSVTAEQMNVKGLTVSDTNNSPTFTIDNAGEVSISGEVISSNFSDTEGEEAGYKISKNGDAVFNQATLRGDVITTNAGISSYGSQLGGENLLPMTDYDNITDAQLTEAWSYFNSPHTTLGIKTYNWGEQNSADHSRDSFIFEKRVLTFSVDLTSCGDYRQSGINPYDRKDGRKHAYLELEPDTDYTLSGWFYVGGGVKSHSWTLWSYDDALANRTRVKDSGNMGAWTGNFVFKEVTFRTPAGRKYYELRWYNNYDPSATTQTASTLHCYQLKFEKGSKATRWSPMAGDGVNYVRFWAGASYEDRNKAPFIVYQDGTIKATKGDFGGTFTGSIDIGNIHIKDTNDSQASFKINTNNETSTSIELTDSNALFNVDMSMAGLLGLSKASKEIEATGKLSFHNTLKGGASMNYFSGNSYTVFDSFGVDGGSHKVFYKTGQGGLTFRSEGASSVSGKTYNQDFLFDKSSGSVEVRVHGNLTVTESLKMNDSNKIEMVSVNTAGNSGIDFMLR